EHDGAGDLDDHGPARDHHDDQIEGGWDLRPLASRPAGIASPPTSSPGSAPGLRFGPSTWWAPGAGRSPGGTAVCTRWWAWAAAARATPSTARRWPRAPRRRTGARPWPAGWWPRPPGGCSTRAPWPPTSTPPTASPRPGWPTPAAFPTGAGPSTGCQPAAESR